MIQDIEKIEYRNGMLEEGTKISDLPIKTITASKITPEIYKLINEINILNLGGFYGAKGLGDPDEYDNLKIFLTDDVVEIEFYNRGITLFSTNDENITNIHRLMCKISD